MDILNIRNKLREGYNISDLKLKVAYYARVSTDKEDQLNSLENQKNYFEEKIKENKNWVFINGYIDEGISGTAIKNRLEFLKMIEDSKNKKIDLILTKEISRFSRNTVDSINYTNELLKYGVAVYFISDNINTLQEDSEFRLTLMSSLAQDEVRKLSERIKFGIKRMIKDKKVLGGNVTGYYKKNGILKINEQEKEIITYLFNTYVSGNTSLKQISLELAEMGYLNSKEKPYSQVTLSKMLTNPRYKGYYTAHLTEIENYKTHKKIKIPKENQILEKDKNIPIIINEELWNKANEIYNKRKRRKSRNILNSNNNLKESKYSNLIICSECHNTFIRMSGGNRKNNPVWVCKTYKEEGKNICSSPIIPEKILDEILIKIFKKFLNPYDKIIKNIKKDYEEIYEKINKNNLEKKEKKLEKIKLKKEKLLDYLLNEIIDEKEYKNKKIFLEKEEEKEIETSTIILNKISLNDLNIRKELKNLIKIFVKKIKIYKINNNRKNIKIKIIFNEENLKIEEEIFL